jgi:hypothetical protein
MVILDSKLRIVGMGDVELAPSDMCLFDYLIICLFVYLFDYVVNLKGLLIIALLPLF